jgi:hypothetical protein
MKKIKGWKERNKEGKKGKRREESRRKRKQ